MTAIVGVLCDDGIVIGSDSAMTFAHPQMGTMEQPADKIDIISNSVILTGTGEGGLGQRFREIVKEYWKSKKFTGNPINVVKDLSRSALQDFQHTGITFNNHQMIGYGALLAFPCEKNFYLCEFDAGKFQPEMKDEKIWYCSMGITQRITDPFLGFIRRIFWEKSKPNLSQGILTVKWTLQHAIELNTGGVNGPIHIAILQKNGGGFSARKLSEDELGEYKQNIQVLYEHIRKFWDKLDPDKGQNIPDVPKK